ncbi:MULTISPECIES: GTPase Era [Roseomonadaceae]|uniref:GTPase Era n=1 Tax=Falsiroseomonas oleicola TaxID=2801474 RepID=A0ABS6HAZ3_9PROT|nr:GTPase Era [Roseomonas oleicola]MBU8545853.1 GTPase Era [Roseomonas oleicola]
MSETETPVAVEGPRRCGLVAIVGAPNAGKSTLVNALTGTKVTIVSPKPQTTRFRIRAVVMQGLAQIVLVDTPGIFAPRRRLDRAMVAAAWGGAQDADLAVLIVDARAGLTDAVREIAEKLKHSKRPTMLLLNKADLVEAPRLLPLAQALNEIVDFQETFMVSALKGRGLDRVLEVLARNLPEGPWLFPEDDLSDLPQRMLAAEIVREQVLRQTHEEVPHHATVETESWAERKDGSARIDVTIYVTRSTQKAILIGDGGAKIKSIGQSARRELEALLERRIHLFVNVKERAGWDEERGRIRALGLEDQG